MCRPIDLGDGEHVREVGGAVFLWRRADSDELEQAVPDTCGGVRRELEAPLAGVAPDELSSPGS